MILKKRELCQVVLLALGILARPQMAKAQSYILPSSAYRTGANGAEYQMDVRILNQGTSAVTITATFYDQETSTTFPASPFQIPARSQAAFDNILQSLFGRPLSQGAYGPIRFDTTGPILVNSNVNNVNACGAGAVSGQWLPGIIATQALTAGVIGELAVSASTGHRISDEPGVHEPRNRARNSDGERAARRRNAPVDGNDRAADTQRIQPGSARRLRVPRGGWDHEHEPVGGIHQQPASAFVRYDDQQRFGGPFCSRGEHRYAARGQPIQRKLFWLLHGLREWNMDRVHLDYRHGDLQRRHPV